MSSSSLKGHVVSLKGLRLTIVALTTLAIFTYFLAEVMLGEVYADPLMYHEISSPFHCNTTDFNNLVIIGALGGSGTRGIQMMLARVGWFGGWTADIHGDSSCSFSMQSKERQVIAQLKMVNYTLTEAKRILIEDFNTTERRLKSRLEHCESIALSDSGMCVWGFKNPRSYYFWPFYSEMYPTAKFIQVVRDGRDMAFSNNTQQFDTHHDTFLPQTALSTWPKEEQLAYFWSTVNTQVATFGKSLGSKRYMQVRVEDLITSNLLVREKTIRGIIGFVFENVNIATEALSEEVISELMSVFDVPVGVDLLQVEDTYGKWKNQPEDIVKAVERRCNDGLIAFGYK